eukprot:403350633
MKVDQQPLLTDDKVNSQTLEQIVQENSATDIASNSNNQPDLLADLNDTIAFAASNLNSLNQIQVSLKDTTNTFNSNVDSLHLKQEQLDDEIRGAFSDIVKDFRAFDMMNEDFEQGLGSFMDEQILQKLKALELNSRKQEDGFGELQDIDLENAYPNENIDGSELLDIEDEEEKDSDERMIVKRMIVR